MFPSNILSRRVFKQGLQNPDRKFMSCKKVVCHRVLFKTLSVHSYSSSTTIWERNQTWILFQTYFCLSNICIVTVFSCLSLYTCTDEICLNFIKYLYMLGRIFTFNMLVVYTFVFYVKYKKINYIGISISLFIYLWCYI